MSKASGFSYSTHACWLAAQSPDPGKYESKEFTNQRVTKPRSSSFKYYNKVDKKIPLEKPKSTPGPGAYKDLDSA